MNVSEGVTALSQKKFADRNALVLGGSGGLGTAIALDLGKAGCSVAVHYHEQKEKALSTVDRINQLDVTAAAVAGDLSVPGSAPEIVQRAREALGGPIHILVYCAGVVTNNSGWQTESADSLLRAYTINAMGAVLTAQAVQQDMAEAGWGRIVVVSTIYGELASPWVLSYSMSKAALDAAVKALSSTCAEAGITVNAVAPGNIDTAMTRRSGEEYIADVVGKTPLRRLGSPEEVAEAVTYLCGAGFLTGTTITVDGGLSRA
ncbi:SDR family NAD(P)-dependent oxidoreductase [Streptosporangium sp. G11]|uniref:SDR family NAD(P)-dependent oxidoreductase n=1 Tax=Streptosporangium sp. G11 TaxID=3436926 RepID=UPI003EBF9070